MPAFSGNVSSVKLKLMPKRDIAYDIVGGSINKASHLKSHLLGGWDTIPSPRESALRNSRPTASSSRNKHKPYFHKLVKILKYRSQNSIR